MTAVLPSEDVRNGTPLPLIILKTQTPGFIDTTEARPIAAKGDFTGYENWQDAAVSETYPEVCGRDSSIHP